MSSFPKELRIPLHSSLHKEDTEERTYGCRHSNPDICKYCYVDEVCAFVSKTLFVKTLLANGKGFTRILRRIEIEIL